MRPNKLLKSTGWLALVAMLLLSSPGVRISADAEAPRIAGQGSAAGR